MLESLSGNMKNALQINLAQVGIGPHFSVWLLLLTIVIGIIFVSMIGFYVTRFVMLRSIAGLARNGNLKWMGLLEKHRVMHRLVWFVPLMLCYVALPLIDITQIPFINVLSLVMQSALLIAMIFVGVATMNAILNCVEESYRSLEISRKYSIKSYLQVIKIFTYLFAGILVVSVLFDQSPLYYLTGLGAMTAIIMLIFKDSIQGFVASIQMSAYDILRLGDWVEIASYGADGTVIDISLNTIKVQNFDKTIVTIPSSAILTAGVKNWRGMKESGGRRIKRSFFVDVSSIKFCNAKLLEKISRIGLMRERLHQITKGSDAREQVYSEISSIINTDHCVSNLTLFRAYLEEYLRTHPRIHSGMTFLVRELQDQGTGIPVELYIFTNDTDWGIYESVQAEIFDHIFAIMPLFELSAFQHSSGSICQIQPG